MYPLTIVEARAIGVMRMRDEKGIDDKIVAVSVHDPAFADYTDKAQLPAHLLREMRRFFEDYKALEKRGNANEIMYGQTLVARDHGRLHDKPFGAPRHSTGFATAPGIVARHRAAGSVRQWHAAYGPSGSRSALTGRTPAPRPCR